MKLQTLKNISLAGIVSLLVACGGSGEVAKTLPIPEPVVPPTEEPVIFPEDFYFGNDLSYVNEMEDCGAVFQEADAAVDPYDIMANHGTNLVRVRLWNDPWWQELITQDDAVAGDRQTQYSNLADATETIQRAKAAGMDVMLDMHLSDFWADATNQVTPRAWEDLWGDDDALGQAVYDYVTSVLASLNDQDLLPEIIKVGNEANGGMLTHEALTAVADGNGVDIGTSGGTDTSEAHVALMWNSAIKAVRDFSEGMDNPPRIALHVANSHRALGFMDWVTGIGVTDFDIIGFSYYYAWHGSSISGMAGEVRKLQSQYPDYDPMLVETGYPWDNENIDDLGNIINEADPEYAPLTQQNQLKYMVDISQALADAGGIGVIFWEPGWVSTDCRTPWGQGSSHEHVAYFDHRDNNNFHIGGTWMEASYMSMAPTGGLVTDFYLNVDDTVDISGGMHIRGDFTEDTAQPMTFLGNNTFRYSTRVADGDAGTYHFLNNAALDSRETVIGDCTDGTDRTYTVGSSSTEFAHVWESCDTFEPLIEVAVRFNVDMSATDHSNGGHVTGEFNGWTLQPMTYMGNGIYSHETILPPGTTSAFYFLNDDVWVTAREDVPEECSLAWDDRQFSLPNDQESVTFSLFWESCDSFDYDNPPIDDSAQFTDITVNVDMSAADISNGVYISGDLNNWQIQPMTDIGDGLYSIALEQQVGATGGYYILNGNDWPNRETVPAECIESGDTDRGFTVAADDILNVVWESCETFSLASVETTISVDMTGIDTSGGVYIAGDLTDWAITPMSNILGSEAYSITLELTPDATGAFYFLNGNDWPNRETVPAECIATGSDRGYTVPADGTHAISLLWASCATFTPPAPLIEVTLHVDMSGIDTSGGVYVTGDLNSWSLQAMTLLNTDTYAVTLQLPANSTGGFYFLNGNDWANREAVPAECIASGSDRGYTVSGSGSQEINLVWASCDTFTPKVEVTLNVDMTGTDISGGVYVAGELNGWSLQAMTETSTNIYSLTLYLDRESSGGFYFLNGNDWGNRETVPAECIVSGSDRGYAIGSAGTQAINAHWASCETFQPGKVTFKLNVDMTSADVSGGVYVAGDLTGWTIDPLTETSTNIYSTTLFLNPSDTGLFYFLNGNDWPNRETVPPECIVTGSDRGYTVNASGIQTSNLTWASCVTW